MDSSSPPSENPSPSKWVSTRNPPVAQTVRGRPRLRAIPRRGGLAGRVLPIDDGSVHSRSRRTPVRRDWLRDDSPSPPRAPSPIRRPYSPGHFGNLRRRQTDWPESNWRPPPPLEEGYERRTRFETPTPSPPHSPHAKATLALQATPPRATASPPPIAVEEDGLKGSTSCSLGDPCYYRNGMPIYFPFHPTTQEWGKAEAEAERQMKEDGLHLELSPVSD